jgi:acylphosphatase
MTKELSQVLIIVHGSVQGVYYRVFVKDSAIKLGVNGYVRNLTDGTVEVNAEGEKEKLNALIDYLRLGPVRASVTDLDITWLNYTNHYINFEIRY